MAKKKTYIPKSTDDLRAAAVDMSKREARFLIETTYKWGTLQQATRAYAESLHKDSFSNKNILFVRKSILNLRTQIKNFLSIWVENYPAAKYFKDNIKGVGPIISAGLAAYIDIDKCPNHYSSLWKFAGLTPNSRPPMYPAVLRAVKDSFDLYGTGASEKHVRYLCTRFDLPYEKIIKFVKKDGKIRWPLIYATIKHPKYCVPLKLICNSLGNDIIKHKSVYQDLFRYRYHLEYANSEAGKLEHVAKAQLATFKFNPKRVAYKAYKKGKLPLGHINARARRWTVKVFLAHYYQIEYYVKHGEAPPDVYALDILKGHRKIHIPGDWKAFVDERSKIRKWG